MKCNENTYAASERELLMDFDFKMLEDYDGKLV